MTSTSFKTSLYRLLHIHYIQPSALLYHTLDSLASYLLMLHNLKLKHM
jgi:hypothetical protein